MGIKELKQFIEDKCAEKGLTLDGFIDFADGCEIEVLIQGPNNHAALSEILDSTGFKYTTPCSIIGCTVSFITIKPKKITKLK